MEGKKKMNKEKIAILFLAVLLIIAVSYSVVNDYVNAQRVKDNAIFQQGVRAGYEQAVVQLFEEALKCDPVPLFIGTLGNQTINKTINVIAVDCIRQAQNASV